MDKIFSVNYTQVLFQKRHLHIEFHTQIITRLSDLSLKWQSYLLGKSNGALEHKLDFTLRCGKTIKALTHFTSALTSQSTPAALGMTPNIKHWDVKLAPSGPDTAFAGKRHITTPTTSCLTFQIFVGRQLSPNHPLLTTQVNLPLKSTWSQWPHRYVSIATSFFLPLM